MLEEPKAEPSFLLSQLPDKLREQGLELSTDPEAYLESYLGYKMEPKQDPDADWRLDVMAGSTCCVPLINGYLNADNDFMDDRAFLKIGQQNPSNTVALRDRTTLETENVPMRESQLLELYTFCLIDFESGIVSYIGINGAPKISAVRNLFDQTLEPGENTSAHLAAIMTDDILQVLVRKHIISKVSVTVAVPEDQILSDIGLDIENFDAIRNVRTKTATYILVGRRNKNIFTSSSKLAEMIAAIKIKFGDNLQGLTANAKDYNEKSQTYDLLQYNFTKTVVLGREDEGLLTLDDFKDALVNTYDLYRTELLRYCRS